MGWGNPAVSWSEMERVLNGKPRRAGESLGKPPGDGGDSPAWSRKRGAYQAEDIARDWCARAGIPYLGRAAIGHSAANHIVPLGTARRP